MITPTFLNSNNLKLTILKSGEMNDRTFSSSINNSENYLSARNQDPEPESNLFSKGLGSLCSSPYSLENINEFGTDDNEKIHNFLDPVDFSDSLGSLDEQNYNSTYTTTSENTYENTVWAPYLENEERIMDNENWTQGRIMPLITQTDQYAANKRVNSPLHKSSDSDDNESTKETGKKTSFDGIEAMKRQHPDEVNDLNLTVEGLCPEKVKKCSPNKRRRVSSEQKRKTTDMIKKKVSYLKRNTHKSIAKHIHNYFPFINRTNYCHQDWIEVNKMMGQVAETKKGNNAAYKAILAKMTSGVHKQNKLLQDLGIMALSDKIQKMRNGEFERKMKTENRILYLEEFMKYLTLFKQ